MPRRVKAPKIDTRSARSKLPRCREPYWARIAKSCFLGYRKGSTGGTWIARWQKIDGSKVYESLGNADDELDADGSTILTFDQAQDHVRIWCHKKARPDTWADDSLTVVQAINEYVAYLYRECARSTAYATEKRSAKHILPPLGDLEIEKLTGHQLQRWLEGLVPAGIENPEDRRRKMDSANHCLTVLKAALNRFYQQGRVSSDDAWRRVRPFKATTAARKVFLTEDESQRLLNACHDPALRNLVEAGLLTGARFGELAKMRTRDFDPPGGLWTVAQSKTGPRVTVLTRDGVALFEQLTAGNSADELIFIRADGRSWNNDRIRKPFAGAACRAKLDPEATYYCLRHTYISWALKRGVPAQVIAENTGTSVRMIERHYGKFLLDDKRAMLERAAPSFAEQQPSSVVRFGSD